MSKGKDMIIIDTRLSAAVLVHFARFYKRPKNMDTSCSIITYLLLKPKRDSHEYFNKSIVFQWMRRKKECMKKYICRRFGLLHNNLEIN